MKALFIGRFQPFHNGHLKVIKQVSKQYQHIIIGVGSSQYSHTLKNPFSYPEREKMIKQCLLHEQIKHFEIVAIPDIHNPPKWVEHVESITPAFDVVISNNTFNNKLFIEKGYQIQQTSMYKRDKYCGEEIRKQMINNQKWETLVPDTVAKIIKEINGVKRLQDIAEEK